MNFLFLVFSEDMKRFVLSMIYQKTEAYQSSNAAVFAKNSRVLHLTRNLLCQANEAQKGCQIRLSQKGK
jgi:hypothetical protein